MGMGMGRPSSYSVLPLGVAVVLVANLMLAFSLEGMYQGTTVTSIMPASCSDHYYFDGPCGGPPGTSCCTDEWCKGVCRQHLNKRVWGWRCVLSDTCECRHPCN